MLCMFILIVCMQDEYDTLNYPIYFVIFFIRLQNVTISVRVYMYYFESWNLRYFNGLNRAKMLNRINKYFSESGDDDLFENISLAVGNNVFFWGRGTYKNMPLVQLFCREVKINGKWCSRMSQMNTEQTRKLEICSHQIFMIR